MGKALVINGLVVNNPLCVVNIGTSPLDAALMKYYAANTSIDSNEKTALEAFVQGLMDAGLWSKVKYFYPMLGNNVDDLVLEVNGESELLGGDKETLSADSRNLVANVGRTGNASLVPQMLKDADFSNMSIFASGSAPAHQRYTRYILRLSAQNRQAMAIQGDTYAYPSISSGSVTAPTQGTDEGQSGIQQSYLERIVSWSIKDGSAAVYKDGVRYASTDYVPVDNNYGITNILSNIKYSSSAEDQPYKYSFLAFADGMSDSEVSQFYELQLAFLKAVGKHS